MGETYQGKCYCGATQYTVCPPLDEVDLCHCSQCRRANGGAFNVAVIVETDQVTFTNRDKLREFSGTLGKYRAFCGDCGSPIFSRTDALPKKLRLRGGTIENLPEPKNLRHIFYSSKWSWIETICDAPKFDEK